MSYILDTNAIIAVIEDRPSTVRRNWRARVRPQEVVLVPAIAAFELWYGVAKSRDRARNIAEVSLLFASQTQVVPFDAEDAKAAGEIRAELEKRGTPIGPYDVLIAAQAMRRGAILVTTNVREFARIDGLTIEDWTRSR